MPEKRGHWKTLKVPSRKTRVRGRKLDCLNPNPQRCNRTLAATASRTQRYQGPPVRFCGRPPPTGKAMENDFIEGDEWDA
jgi:hypothetical protein